MGNKKLLRQEMLAVRKKMSDELRRSSSKQICDKLINMEEYLKAKFLMLYYPLAFEVDIRALMQDGWRRNKVICLPRMNNSTLVPYEVKDNDKLIIGKFKVLEPANDPATLVDTNKIDLCIVPGVAFAINGYRLGYGGGYYDRFLTELSVASLSIGVAFSESLVPTVYPEPHDQRMDLIVTTNKIIRT